jgi:NADH:ubiquinone reductase (non-electrogenic)
MEPVRWYCERTGHSGARYVQAECTGVDIKSKVVKAVGNNGSSFALPYDHLVISVGCEPATFGIPGVKEHAIFMKEVENGMQVQRKLLQSLEAANDLLVAGADSKKVDELLHWVIIGGGPTGNICHIKPKFKVRGIKLNKSPSSR